MGAPATRDNTEPVTQDEFSQGMWISLLIGVFYALNGFVPMLVWFGGHKDTVLQMQGNKVYKAAWKALFVSHIVVYVPMAVIWPFTYIGSTTIVEFYDLANWYVGTLAAGAIFVTVTFMWMLAALSYEEQTSSSSATISESYMWIETLLYIFMEAFGWYTTVWEYPKAHS